MVRHRRAPRPALSLVTIAVCVSKVTSLCIAKCCAIEAGSRRPVGEATIHVFLANARFTVGASLYTHPEPKARDSRVSQRDRSACRYLPTGATAANRAFKGPTKVPADGSTQQRKATLSPQPTHPFHRKRTSRFHKRGRLSLDFDDLPHDFFDSQCNSLTQPTCSRQFATMPSVSAHATTGGFSAWPPSPPNPPPAPAMSAAVNLRAHPEFPLLKRKLPGCDQNHRFSDCELIVVLESKHCTTRRQQYPHKHTKYEIIDDRILTPISRSCNSKMSRDLNVLATSTMSPVLYEPFEADHAHDAPWDVFDDFYPRSTNDGYAFAPTAPDQTIMPKVDDVPFDMDSLMNCDITSLDAYIHSDVVDGGIVYSEDVYCDVDVPTSSDNSPISSDLYTSSSVSTVNYADVDPVEEFFPQLVTDREGPTISGSRESTVSFSSPPVSDYRHKRDKNNVASQRSRQKRQQKIREAREEKDRLEKRNVELRTLFDSLQSQVDDYKSMVLMMVSKRGV